MSAFAQSHQRPRTKPEKTMSIGQVLARLRADFPDVKESKLRFLDGQGLVTPQRTSSGYRRYVEADVERLHWILSVQRDQYLPLKVIREQLEAMDSGALSPLKMKQDSAQPMIDSESFRPALTRLTDVDVAERAGVDVEFVSVLHSAGLLKTDEAGFFSPDDVSVVQTAVKLKEYGFDDRRLKSLRNAAIRQADLIQQVARPVAHSKEDTAREHAHELSVEMSALVVSLHAQLVKNELRDELGR